MSTCVCTYVLSVYKYWQVLAIGIVHATGAPVRHSQSVCAQKTHLFLCLFIRGYAVVNSKLQLIDFLIFFSNLNFMFLKIVAESSGVLKYKLFILQALFNVALTSLHKALKRALYIRSQKYRVT